MGHGLVNCKFDECPHEIKTSRKEMRMTHNQINYWNLQESKRHNVEGEKETNRHNLATEGETYRHNVSSEGIDISKLNETKRHNVQSEGIESGKLAEQQRHNIQTENVDISSLQELGRHNRESEVSDRIKANASGTQAAASLFSAQESARHNMANEALQQQDLNIRSDSQSEVVRHNTATENLTSLGTQAQVRLQESQALINEIDSMWRNAQNNANLQLSKAQKDKINNDIAKMHVEMDKMRSDIKRNRFQNVESTSRTLQNLSKGIMEPLNSAQSALRNLGGLMR